MGCGNGVDAEYFSSLGFHVTATDFSKAAIFRNTKKQSKVDYQMVDIQQPFLFPDSSFDVVYARLSLHYFPDKKTREIFHEIFRVLRPGGLVCFLCKSTRDPLWRKGEKLEEDMYSENGHVRHFFSQEYTKACILGLFAIEKLASGAEDFYNSSSAYISCIARKSS